MSSHTKSGRRAGYECEAEQIAEMRGMFADQTVKRYTADMPEPAPRNPLSAERRSQLMQSWR